MKKVAVFVEELYQVLELWYPYYRLKEAGLNSILIGTGKGVYHSKTGYPAKEEMRIQDAKPEEFSAVIIPGGFAPDHMRRHPEMVAFVKQLYEAGKPVAAICHGPWMMASAEILKGKKATSFFAIKDDIVHAGAVYCDQEVVVDGNLITSRTPNDLPAFCGEVLKMLGQ